MSPNRLAVPVLAALLLAVPAPPAAAAEIKAAARPLAPRAVAARTPAEHLVLPFVEDDYPRALQLARQRKLPIFVESWAPW